MRKDRRIVPAKPPQAKSWPHPEHSVQDRDRLIAQAYRRIAFAANPENTRELDRELATYGIGWPYYEPMESGAEYLTRDDVADLAQVRPTTVSQWAKRGYLTRYPQGYLREEVEAFLAKPRAPGRPAAA